MTPEIAVQNLVCGYLRRLGIFFWKNDSVGIFDPRTQRYRRNNSPFKIKGVADILGILPSGRFLAIELKSERGRCTPEQTAFLSQIKASGGVAFVARSIKDVEEGLHEYIGQGSATK